MSSPGSSRRDGGDARAEGRGALTSAWSPGRPGAVLMLEVPDARRRPPGPELPLVQAALIRTEVIPLHPFDL